MTPLFDFITEGGETFAIIVRNVAAAEKYNFPTAPGESLQLGVLRFKAGDVVAPHAHHPKPAQAIAAQEFFIVQSGQIVVAVYREDGSQVARQPLGPGEAILLLRGGHGIEFSTDAQVLEVKTGPYVERKQDKYDLPTG
jgi:hypothetical protein